MKPLSKIIFLMMALGLMACQQYSDGSMVGDFQSNTYCPASGCANATADPTTLSLASTLTAVNSNSTVQHVDVGGDCYVSTYPNNAINVQVLSGSSAVAPGISGEQAVSQSVKCHGGHFEVAIDTSGLASPAIYTINLNLVAIDSTGNQFTNAGGGTLNITLRR